jgi:hypothetical protein
MSSIPTTCNSPPAKSVPSNDWVWTVVKFERVSDLEDLALKCYETLIAERPTIKSLLHFPMGAHVVERSKKKLPEYRRACLLLSIFTFTSLSQRLISQILAQYYRHRDGWRFLSFMNLVGKAAAGEAPFGSRDLVWVMMDLLSKYLSNWDLTGRHVPVFFKFHPLPIRTSHSSRSTDSLRPSSSPKILVIEDDQSPVKRPPPVKRKLGVK